MAGGKESLFAQFTMLNYLKSASGGKTVRQILTYLQNNTDWGRAKLASASADGGLRDVQNWLKGIRECPELGHQIEWEEDPGNRKQLRYKSRLPVVGNRIMPIEEALTLLMAEKFLQAAIPVDFYEESLHDLFIKARAELKKYDLQPKNTRQLVSSYLKRLAIVQRGQQLVEKMIPYDVLGVIAKAILDGKCVELKYQGEKRMLHPYAIILRSPKIYLLAIDDYVMSKGNVAKLIPTQFLCARISDASVSAQANWVPADFNAEHFIEHGGLDVDVDGAAHGSGRAFTLRLRIVAGDSDNLLQDLQEFPLSSKQKVEKIRGTGDYLLKASGMRATHQLTEWIVGRLDRVEVLAPERLRLYVAEQVDDLQKIYSKTA